MADITLIPQQMTVAGIAPSYTGSLSTSNTYYAKNSGRLFLHFKKAGAGDCTVTIDTPGQVGGLDIAQRTVTVPATTGDIMVGPLVPTVYSNASDNIKFTLSEITGLTVGVITL